MSGFPSKLTTAEAKELLETFAPYVWLHSEEENFPCSVEWYLDRVRVGFAKLVPGGYSTEIVAQNASIQTLNEMSFEGLASGGALSGAKPSAEAFFTLPVIDKTNSGTYAGWKPKEKGKGAYTPKGTPPIYGGVIDRHDEAGDVVIGYDLVYAFFYAYNGEAMNDIGFGTHEADWEHVVARVDADKQTLLAVYYRQHASDDKYNAWYYPPGPDEPQAGGELFEAYSEQRCVVYSAKASHASYPRLADDWYYNAFRGRDVVDQGYAWDTKQNVVVMNDPSQDHWLDYSGRFGASPPRISTQFQSLPPENPIVQSWQVSPAAGPFVEREVYCQHLKGQKSRVSSKSDFDIAQVRLRWVFADPNGWLSANQLNNIEMNLNHDVKGGDQRSIEGLKNGFVTDPPYKYTNKVYFAGLKYTDKKGEVHTRYDDAWKAMTNDSSAPAGNTISFLVVVTWEEAQDRVLQARSTPRSEVAQAETPAQQTTAPKTASPETTTRERMARENTSA